jgi:hypothetical protein
MTDEDERAERIRLHHELTNWRVQAPLSRLNEYRTAVVERWTAAMEDIQRRASAATEDFQRLEVRFNRDWAPYRARWARKRTPKYLAKGGVKR